MCSPNCPSCGAPFDITDTHEIVRVMREDGTLEWWVACEACKAPESARLVARITPEQLARGSRGGYVPWPYSEF